MTIASKPHIPLLWRIFLRLGSSSSCCVPFSDNSSLNEQRSPVEDFVDTIKESSVRLMAHNTDFVKRLLSKGEMASLFSVLSGLSLMRNRFWYFNEDIIIDCKNKHFQEEYVEVVEMIEATLTQLVEYQTSLIATTILHDAESQR